MNHTMNRRQRRASKSKMRSIRIDRVDSMCDIQVEAKIEQVVMILANSRGLTVVEDLWPDVEWTTDEKFASYGHSDDWLFTHIRVTKLPPHLETTVPLAFASPDALGLAVSMALQRLAEPGRVIHWTGEGADVKINMYDVKFREPDLARSLFAEHVPAGTEVGPLMGVN